MRWEASSITLAFGRGGFTSPPGLIITRRLKCGLCGTEFEARCAIYKEDEVGYTHPDMIPGCQMGEKPVF